jgi:cytoskeletal protein RodZ
VTSVPELKVLTPHAGASIGETLKDARETQRLSLQQAAQATRIKRDFLQALENDDFAALPGTTYTKGFLRNYGRFLNLDVEMLLNRYRETAGDQEQVVSTAPAIRPIRHPRPLTATMLILVFMMLLAGAFVYYLGNQLARYEATRRALASPSAAQESAAVALPAYEPTPSPVVAATPVPTPAPPLAPVEVIARVDAPVWLQVEVDGKQVQSGTVPAGTTLPKWAGNSKIVIFTGNAKHLFINHNGRDLGPLSTTQDVVTKAFEKQP